MNIYFGHSNNYSFKDKLYTPIRNSFLNSDHNILLPHEYSSEPFNSKDFLKTCGLMIAEVTYPSTGLGMELGWANLYEVPIVAIHKEDKKVSGSIKVVTSNIISYKGNEDMIEKLVIYIRNL